MNKLDSQVLPIVKVSRVGYKSDAIHERGDKSKNENNLAFYSRVKMCSTKRGVVFVM